MGQASQRGYTVNSDADIKAQAAAAAAGSPAASDRSKTTVATTDDRVIGHAYRPDPSVDGLDTAVRLTRLLPDTDAIDEPRSPGGITAGPVSGIARLQDRIYIVTLNALHIYDARTFRRVDTMTDERRYAGDLASSPLHGCLYAFDDHTYCIYRLQTGRGGDDDEDGPRDRNTTSVEEWLETGEQSYELKLSTTGDGCVVTLSNDPPWLDVYGADSRLLFTVLLPPSMIEPQHAVETKPSGSFIVAHGSVNSPLHRVCEVMRDGTVLKSYGGRRGSEPGQLDGPVHLAVDRENRIYVADRYNSRVIVLDAETFTALRVLPVCDGTDVIDYPLRLCYDTEDKRLMIGLYSGAVDIYGRV